MLIDNEKDPQQMHNVAQKPEYAPVMEELMQVYKQVREQYRVPQDSPGSSKEFKRIEPSWGPGENDRLKY